MDVDVAIVGAGPAGLGAAYRLRESGLTVKVFEELDHVGGRTRSATVAGEVVNTGAMFVYVGTESEAICRELGIETVPVTPATFGVSFGGRTVIAREDADLIKWLDLPEDAKAELARVMRDVREEYEAYTGGAGLTEASRRLAEVSLSDHLGKLHPAVDGIVRNAVRGGSTADPDVLSAQYALRYFASYLVRAAGHRRYLPQGMQQMSLALKDRLEPGTLRMRSKVEAVAALAAGGYEVRVATPEGRRRFEAGQVIFAVPGPAVAELAPWLPSWKLDAIGRVPTSPTTTLSIVLDSSGKPEWDDMFFIVTVDAPFNMVLQPRASADIVPSVCGRTHFNCYLSADAAAAAPGDDEAMTQAWLEDFFRVLPDARGRVLGTVLTRWPRCFSYPAPDRAAVIGDVRAAVGGVHFAGDYTSDTAGSHGAFAEGNRVAREVFEAVPRAKASIGAFA